MAHVARGEPVFGVFVTIPSAKVIENLAVPGYLDFVWIEGSQC
jgi:2-keto-3-deoxy-L-rhamnonate aldolase RhmA